MNLMRYGVGLATTAAAFLVAFAGAAVWLLTTDPVTVANAVTEGEITALVSELAAVVYRALLGLLRFLG